MGFLSPPGGKLKTDIAESPFQCAVREANEECGIVSEPKDWKLLGIVTEKNYPNIGNIMMFLLEYNKPLDLIPKEFAEGSFEFVPQSEIMNACIPESDKLYIWNYVLKNNDTIFSISIDCDISPFSCSIEKN
jgi:8-oxo-dGTP pyrophosphatase MutT (NUDIX family)